MNAAIRCQCGLDIIYDWKACDHLRCPKCDRRWVQQFPPMVDDAAIEALRLPYLCAGLDAKTDDPDAQEMEILQRVRMHVIKHNEMVDAGIFKDRLKMPESVGFVFSDGNKLVPILPQMYDVGVHAMNPDGSSYFIPSEAGKSFGMQEGPRTREQTAEAFDPFARSLKQLKEMGEI